jgi:hypothetical protein
MDRRKSRWGRDVAKSRMIQAQIAGSMPIGQAIRFSLRKPLDTEARRLSLKYLTRDADDVTLEIFPGARNK